MRWPRFHGFPMIAKDLIPEVGSVAYFGLVTVLMF
jgi:hypothetical protein